MNKEAAVVASAAAVQAVVAASAAAVQAAAVAVALKEEVTSREFQLE